MTQNESIKIATQLFEALGLQVRVNDDGKTFGIYRAGVQIAGYSSLEYLTNLNATARELYALGFSKGQKKGKELVQEQIKNALGL